MTGRASFTDLGTYSYGNVSIYLINTIIALASLGFPIIFFIVFGDVSGKLIERIGADPGSFVTSRVFTQSFLGIFLFYLVLKKEISSLKYAGLLILCLCFIFLFLLFIHYLTSNPDPEPAADLLDTKIDLSFINGLPTIITIYAFQPTFFSGFNALKNKTNRNGQLADGIGRIGVCMVYCSSPLLAYGIYGDNIKKNFLNNIAEESGFLPITLEIIFLLIPAMSIPIIFFVGKEACLIIFDEITRRSYSKQNKQVNEQNKVKPDVVMAERVPSQDSGRNSENLPNRNDDCDEPANPDVIVEAKPINPKEYLNMKTAYYYGFTSFLYFMVILLSIVVGDVSIFFGLIGATAGCFAIWIGPSSFYIAATIKEKVPLDTKFKI
jgi:amino acid permease